MDWIDEVWDRMLRKFRNMSLRKALSCYIVIGITVVLISYVVTFRILESWKYLVISRYDLIADTTSYFFIVHSFTVAGKTSDGQWKYILEVIELLQQLSILIYSIAAIIVISRLYYRNKLREPLRLLKEEAECISRDDFAFDCRYASSDEMGEICAIFNQMRLQMIANRENIRSLMEEQRRLNAAFAHDIRTPLTVMRGYTELILKYYPEGNISVEQLQDILRMIAKQAKRLEDFSNTMRSIHSIEEMQVQKKRQSIQGICEKLKETVLGLQSVTHLRLKLEDMIYADDTNFYYDEKVIMEVFDNLVGNSLRYAKEQIGIVLSQEEGLLRMYVKDDGKGFSMEGLAKATKPYYTDAEENTGHFGIGLTISRMLCEKHGGYLELSNSIEGGAIVCASFYIL